MQDLLYVSFDKDEKKNECGICVGRQNKDGSHTILKMKLDEQAEILYKLLTEQEAFKLIKNRLNYECKADTLEKIADDINKLKKVSGDRVYVAINDVFDVIDKYRGVNE